MSAISQTQDGYLWVGTDKGPIRFDGLDFRRFERADPGSIAIGPVRTLLADAQRNLWILSQSTKLFRYHDGIFELSRGEAENGITAMGRGATGEILLSSIALGTLTYNGSRFINVSPAALFGGAFSHAASGDSRNPISNETPDDRSARQSWTTGVTPDRLANPASAVISMATTADGKVWLGTEDRGLFYEQAGRVSEVAAGSRYLRVNCILALDSSELWIGTSHGVLRWDGAKVSQTGVPPALSNPEVVSMIRDRDSNIWVGTSDGLLRFQENGGSDRVPSVGGPVTALFEDREGNIWIGGSKSLDRLRDSAFISYSIGGQKSRGAGALYIDPRGAVWLAPLEGGLHRLRGAKEEAVTAEGLGNAIVYSIDGSGEDFWIGRQRAGLTHLRFTRQALRAETYTQAKGLAQDSVYAVHVARDGAVWSGTLTNGVSELRNGRFTTYTTADGLPSNTVSSIAEGSDGTMWFGTPKGIAAKTKNGWRTYTNRDGLPSEDVNCLMQDSTGVLWIGTSAGLACLNAGPLKALPSGPDALHEPIFGIVDDRRGSLWIATANHVLQVNRASLLSAGLDFREYGLADGLWGSECVKRYQSVVADARGQVWFSTNQGLSVVNTARAAAVPAPALVHIEAVLEDGRPIGLRLPIRVSPATQRVTLRYVGLSLANSDRVRCRYRLDGVDHGWSEPVASREVTYPNLGAGSYRFHVIACNSDGIWNGTEAVIAFEVEPTPWQSWWFRLGCVLCAGLAALLIYRVRVHQVTRLLKVRFEERLAERTRIARDLHDTLLQSFQGALLKFSAVRYMIRDRPDEAEKTLDSVIEQARRAIIEGRDAVQGLRSSTMVSNDLARAISEFGGGLAADPAENTPNFQVHLEGASRDLAPTVRDEVYRIAAEALRNAFRHARAKSIDVTIHYEKREFRMLVEDDGKGTDASVLEAGGRAGHHGLLGMQERAKLVGGKLAIRSGIDSGTDIELTIPAAVAYTDPPR